MTAKIESTLTVDLIQVTETRDGRRPGAIQTRRDPSGMGQPVEQMDRLRCALARKL